MSEQNQRILLQQELINIINESVKNNFRIVIMGDFNTNLDRYLELCNSGRKINWKYQLIQTLYRYNFTDLQHISQSTPLPTWFGPSNNTSRIDAIFCSHNFIDEFLFCETQVPLLYHSDHRIVIAYFHYQHEATSAKNRSLLNKKSVPLFHKMDKQNWELFAKETSRYYDQHNFKKLETLTPSQSHINHLWSEIKRLILSCDKNIIPH